MPRKYRVSNPPPTRRTLRADQLRLAGMLFVAMIGSLLAWYLSSEGLSESGLYFIAIPGSMAIMVSLLPSKAADTTFGIVRGTTIAILASAIVIREGFICVLMALPLIVPTVSILAWSGRSRRKGQVSAVLVPLLLLAFATEGVLYDLPDQIQASETRTIDTTTDELLASLAEPAELPRLEPALFQLPFPRPTAFVGQGADIGDVRIVEFGEMGQLTLQITDKAATSISWSIIEDTTPMSGWMDFHQTTARWNETPAGLDVTVQIDFSRRLSPAVYFDPLQRWGVGEMAEVLMDMIEHNLDLGSVEAATPRG